MEAITAMRIAADVGKRFLAMIRTGWVDYFLYRMTSQVVANNAVNGCLPAYWS
jgi:hypothetical protein